MQRRRHLELSHIWAHMLLWTGHEVWSIYEHLTKSFRDSHRQSDTLWQMARHIGLAETEQDYNISLMLLVNLVKLEHNIKARTERRNWTKLNWTDTV